MANALPLGCPPPQPSDRPHDSRTCGSQRCSGRPPTLTRRRTLLRPRIPASAHRAREERYHARPEPADPFGEPMLRLAMANAGVELVERALAPIERGLAEVRGEGRRATELFDADWSRYASARNRLHSAADQ